MRDKISVFTGTPAAFLSEHVSVYRFAVTRLVSGEDLRIDVIGDEAEITPLLTMSDLRG